MLVDEHQDVNYARHRPLARLIKELIYKLAEEEVLSIYRICAKSLLLREALAARLEERPWVAPLKGVGAAAEAATVDHMVTGQTTEA